MPYADPEKKREYSRQYSKEKVKEGYGKALYRRRALRYRNEEILREAVEQALAEFDAEDGSTEKAIDILAAALSSAPPVGKPIEYME